MPAGKLSQGLVRVMAVVCAVTVANLYYAQPLLHTIAGTFHVSQSSAGVVVTATQLGYAVGLLLIIPLGDVTPRRPLLTVLLAIDAIVLAVSALSASLQMLGALALLVGLTSVVVQMLVPYAATLADDRQRAHVIGTLMGGLLIGILLSRTFASLVDALSGWRVVYGVAALFMAGTALLLFRILPAHGRELSIGYRAQLRGVLHVARTAPVLRWRSLVGACGFAAFSVFWTTAAFLLADRHYGFSQLAIGMFALVGAAGAATAFVAGRFLDANRRLRWRITGVMLAVLVVSFGLIALGADSLGWLIVGVLVMDACVQGLHLVNQSVIYDLLPQARSRLTTVYMTMYFVGGALGSALGSQAYGRWGWGGACAVAVAFGVLGILAWLAAARHERATRSDDTVVTRADEGQCVGVNAD